MTPELSLFFFSADCAERQDDRYRMLFDAAKFADQHGFAAVWTPERHFQRFGGLYGSPTATGAALSVMTSRIGIRAGSVVLPLQNPLRVAEEWAMIDNFSNGRVAIAAASGWHVNDFVLSPGTYKDRYEDMFQKIELIRRLWRGEKISLGNGDMPLLLGVNKLHVCPASTSHLLLRMSMKKRRIRRVSALLVCTRVAAALPRKSVSR